VFGSAVTGLILVYGAWLAWISGLNVRL